MKYSRVFVRAIGYELAPVVVTTQELEHRLQPVLKELKVPNGQLEAWTGIRERRWWEKGYRVSQGAVAAARKCLVDDIFEEPLPPLRLRKRAACQDAVKLLANRFLV